MTQYPYPREALVTIEATSLNCPDQRNRNLSLGPWLRTTAEYVWGVTGRETGVQANSCAVLTLHVHRQTCSGRLQEVSKEMQVPVRRRESISEASVIKMVMDPME